MHSLVASSDLTHRRLLPSTSISPAALSTLPNHLQQPPLQQSIFSRSVAHAQSHSSYHRSASQPPRQHPQSLPSHAHRPALYDFLQLDGLGTVPSSSAPTSSNPVEPLSTA